MKDKELKPCDHLCSKETCTCGYEQQQEDKELEEAAKKYVKETFGNGAYLDIRESFIDGTKHQKALTPFSETQLKEAIKLARLGGKYGYSEILELIKSK